MYMYTYVRTLHIATYLHTYYVPTYMYVLYITTNHQMLLIYLINTTLRVSHSTGYTHLLVRFLLCQALMAPKQVCPVCALSHQLILLPRQP